MEQLTSQLLTQFFSLATVAFIVGLGALVYSLRKLVEAVRPSVRETVWWPELALPVSPIIIGVLVGWLAAKYPYPQVFATATAGRVFYGLVCGFFASKLYRLGWVVLKKYLIKQGIDPSDLESVRPPGPPPPSPPAT